MDAGPDGLLVLDYGIDGADDFAGTAGVAQLWEEQDLVPDDGYGVVGTRLGALATLGTPVFVYPNGGQDLYLFLPLYIGA